MVFKLIESQELTDIHSTGHLYQHEVTGAQLLYLSNGDRNKSFTIGFRTPPHSDDGITHIIEHSVLNGSAKYPSKEPFVELIKGSMNTFANAITFSDKTIYPIASTNDKDFWNLMGVYLDAVFAPNFVEDPQILAQEGWHYHLENAEDDLIYKGVVYNEMKGATASPEVQLYHKMTQALYPGTPYAFESGGAPSAIPSLTQEKFVKYYKEHYHPSNSLTVLYGDLDLEHAFTILEEYFSTYQKQEPINLSFELQVPEEREVEGTYSITEGDDPDQKDYLCLAWHTSLSDNVQEVMALNILADILFGNLHSPLKKALLEAEVAGDVSGQSDACGYTHLVSLTAQYTSADKMPLFKKVVRDTMIQLVEEGLDRELVQASINKISFLLKESVISESNPRGVLYALSSYQTWLYGGSAYAKLQFNDLIEEISQLADKGFFEKLIKEKFLDNDHQVAVILRAEPGLNDRTEANLHQELQAYKAQLSSEQVADLVTQTQALIERQEKEDDPADLAKIPSLSKEDLSSETDSSDLEEITLETIPNKLYFSDQFTSGIDYLSVFLDTHDFAIEEYPALSLLASLIGQMSTEDHDFDQLQKQIDINTGGIVALLSVTETLSGLVTTQFKLFGRSLEDSFEKMLQLMKEILTKTQLNDQKLVQQVIQELISGFEERINFSANGLAIKRALSQEKASMKLEDMIRGIDFFNYIKDCRQAFKEGRGQEVVDQLNEIYDRLLSRDRLSFLYIGNKERLSQVKAGLEAHFSDLPEREMGPRVDYQPGKKQREAFITAQDVNYVGLALNARGKIDYNGANRVLNNYLNFSYLWNNIRVKGGAYGAGINMDRMSNFFMMSYRDPNIFKTIETFKSIAEYIKQINLSEAELLKNIIGALSPLDRPKSAYDLGDEAYSYHLMGMTYPMMQQLKEEIIATSNEDLKNFASQYEQAIADYSLAVIGNKAQIEKEKDLFDAVYELY